MKSFFYLLAACYVFLCCGFTTNAQTTGKNEHTYTSSIFENPDHTFGYSISDKGKKYIHQPSVPGRSGMAGFKTKGDAQKVATFVINKLNKGIFPPSVTEEELKKLRIAP